MRIPPHEGYGFALPPFGTFADDSVRNAVSLGGDANAEVFISGGIDGPFYGEIPECISNFRKEKIDGTNRAEIRKFEDKHN